MAVDFLTDTQKEQYGQYYAEPNDIQLARYFYLTTSDMAYVKLRRGDQNRLGFALQLTTVRFLGTFLTDMTRVPPGAISFVARQLAITDPTIIADYAIRETTLREHKAIIRKYNGYIDFGTPPWGFRLTRYLYTRAWINNERPSLMFDYATAWLIRQKILLPGASTLTRLISSIRERADNRVWKQLSDLATLEQKHKLDTMLTVPEGTRISNFDAFRKGPVRASGPAFIRAVKRHLDLSDFKISELDTSRIPPTRLNALARYAAVSSMHKILRLSDEKRTAVLIAFVHSFETIALDDALDVLDLMMTDIANEAKKTGQKKRLRTLKDLDKSALALAEACSVLLDGTIHDEDIRQEIFSRLPKDLLKSAIDSVNTLARPAKGTFHDEMVEQYGKVKRFLPTLLEHIKFEATPSGRSIHAAMTYLAELKPSRSHLLKEPPIKFVTKPWRRLVFDKQGRVNKQGYTLCLLSRLQDGLRRRDLYVDNSKCWGDPRTKLLDDKEWQAQRTQICRSLGHHGNPKTAIADLSGQLDATYKAVAARFSANDAIKIDYSKKHPSLTLSNLDKLEEPESLSWLRTNVQQRLPKIDLTELMLEINAHTGFVSEFSHVSETNSQSDDFNVSMCAVLLAEACNIGFEPLIRGQIPALTRYRLSWVKQNYLRSETLLRANSCLVNHQSTLDLANSWGGGDVASADGMRFVTPIKTLHAGPNRKYFGSNKGITWYNFVSDQYSGFHGIVIPGTLRDSMYVLEGLLEHQTGLNPTEIMTDTTGTSDMVFGLFWLLGYQFSPRLADAGEAVFWRIDPNANYGALDKLARGKSRPDLVEPHWDDMMRIAGSLTLGRIRASELIRSLLKTSRPSGLARAIIEAGRINKTLYLLNYIDNEEYRRRILTQLNRGEGRHAVARVICHGQRGEIRKRYREGQEDQLGALGLVTNAVTLWNTIYMQEAVRQIESEGTEINECDLKRLSPLLYRHVNVLGNYSFSLAKYVSKGNLRPLSKPQDRD
ncbi:MAG: Tn3 family transposase [Maricaulaceae bacterium]